MSLQGVSKVVDVTLRDGIMFHPVIPTTVKEALAFRLIDAGINQLEVARFPIDDSYPQFKDTVELLHRLQPLRPRAKLAVFAIGESAVEDALRYSDLIDEIHTACFVSEQYRRYVLGPGSWNHSIESVRQYSQLARAKGVELSVGLGTCFGCPIAGDQDPAQVAAKVAELVSTGVETVMLGDTTGTALPKTVQVTLKKITSRNRPKILRAHFHDALGRALLNSWAALNEGADSVDASLLGIGGIPHAYFADPKLANNGNLATEEIVSLIAGEGMTTPAVSQECVSALFAVCRWFQTYVDAPVFGRAAFAEIVRANPQEGGYEVQQGTYRH